jgi:hypothetical protein
MTMRATEVLVALLLVLVVSGMPLGIYLSLLSFSFRYCILHLFV